jgi:hypothetical protein
MLDDESKSLSADDLGSERVSHVNDPELLKAFAALEENLRLIVGQIGRYHGCHLGEQ